MQRGTLPFPVLLTQPRTRRGGWLPRTPSSFKIRISLCKVAPLWIQSPASIFAVNLDRAVLALTFAPTKLRICAELFFFEDR